MTGEGHKSSFPQASLRPWSIPKAGQHLGELPDLWDNSQTSLRPLRAPVPSCSQHLLLSLNPAGSRPRHKEQDTEQDTEQDIPGGCFPI